MSLNDAIYTLAKFVDDNEDFYDELDEDLKGVCEAIRVVYPELKKLKGEK